MLLCGVRSAAERSNSSTKTFTAGCSFSPIRYATEIFRRASGRSLMARMPSNFLVNRSPATDTEPPEATIAATISNPLQAAFNRGSKPVRLQRLAMKSP